METGVAHERGTKGVSYQWIQEKKFQEKDGKWPLVENDTVDGLKMKRDKPLDMRVRRSVVIFRNHFSEVEEMVRNKWTIESECADWRVLHMGIARVLFRNTDSLALTDSKPAFECRCTLGDFPASSVGAAVGSLFRVTGRKRTLTVVSCMTAQCQEGSQNRGDECKFLARKEVIGRGEDGPKETRETSLVGQWLSTCESAFQCRRRKLSPWLGN